MTELEKLASDLITENAGLKNKIDRLEYRLNAGIRVYAEREGIGYWGCSEKRVTKNATLVLDNPDDPNNYR